MVVLVVALEKCREEFENENHLAVAVALEKIFEK